MALTDARRWSEAETEFHRAIELNSNNAAAHYFYAMSFLMPENRLDQAQQEFQTALSLDPLSSIVNANYALLLMEAHRYPESLAQFQKVLERDPNFFPARFKLSQLYATTGRFAEAVNELQKSFPKLKPAGADARGYREMTVAALEETDADRSASLAAASVICGDHDQALHYLEKAYSDGDNALHWIIRYPALDPIRSDPRYVDLMRRLGLPP